MHDYFEILGVAPGAHARDIRAACARHAARPHTDLFVTGQRPAHRVAAAAPPGPELVDVAIDFPDLASIIDRIQAAFFR